MADAEHGPWGLQESQVSNAAWQPIRARDRVFWQERVHPCLHGPQCQACCWPYVLPRYAQRVPWVVGALQGPQRYKNRTIPRAAWELFHGGPMRHGTRAVAGCATLNCANPHHVRIV